MLGSGHQEKKVIYGEEEAMLNYMSKELSVPVVKLLDWKVIDNFRMCDVLLFQCFFILNKMHYDYIIKHFYENYKAIIRSMGNMIDCDSLISIIDTQINNKQVTKDIIDFLHIKEGRK